MLEDGNHIVLDYKQQFWEAASAVVWTVLYQWVSKRGGLSTLPSPSGGIDFSGGADKKFRRESLARLNEFARELRTFQDVDMAGKNFGDEGFIFLAEVLAFNQTLETVDFSANGITATGLKALSQVLPTNTYLKTLNLSGNNIGDEGAQVCAPSIFWITWFHFSTCG
jgi:hypothetical protein